MSVIPSFEAAGRRWPAAAALAALGAWDPAAALVLGPLAAGAREGPLTGAIGALIGLLAGGLLGPVGLSPSNWLLLPIGALLGIAAKKAHPALAIGLPMLLLAAPAPMQGWAPPLALGLLAPEIASLGKTPSRALLVLGLAGLAGNIFHGFGEVTNPTPRAALATWSGGREVVGAGAKVRVWTWGSKLGIQAVNGGPYVAGLPEGEGVSREPDAVDRAEIGERDCKALAPLAVQGDRRARVAHALGDCAPDLGDLAASDPYLDAARVLAGHPPANALAIMTAELADPLDDPSAVVLAARARLGTPRFAANALISGSPFERAMIVARLGQDAGVARELEAFGQDPSAYFGPATAPSSP